MNNKNNPLSPHIQVYSWHISSLVSISHRITGVLNIIALTFVSIWISSMLLGVESYEFVENILNSFTGKFIVIGIIWSFSFQILSEIRHLFWDFGYGFELKISKLTGLIVIFGSFILTILIYLLGKQII
jgi:succinate dehydrogenase / fumarate reductase cytochrome b subunit